MAVTRNIGLKFQCWRYLMISLLCFEFSVNAIASTIPYETARPQLQKESESRKTTSITGMTEKRDGPRFRPLLKNLMKMVGDYMGYGKFDRCHVMPWKVINTQIDKKFSSDPVYLKTFLNDIAKLDKDAFYFKALPPMIKSEYEKLAESYTAEALKALEEQQITKFKAAMYNLPGNLFPGDPSINSSIQDKLDPPKKADSEGKVTDEATEKSKALYKKYSEDGLEVDEIEGKGTGTWVKSSDLSSKESAVKME